MLYIDKTKTRKGPPTDNELMRDGLYNASTLHVSREMKNNNWRTDVAFRLLTCPFARVDLSASIYQQQIRYLFAVPGQAVLDSSVSLRGANNHVLNLRLYKDVIGMAGFSAHHTNSSDKDKFFMALCDPSRRVGGVVQRIGNSIHLGATSGIIFDEETRNLPWMPQRWFPKWLHEARLFTAFCGAVDKEQPTRYWAGLSAQNVDMSATVRHERNDIVTSRVVVAHDSEKYGRTMAWMTAGEPTDRIPNHLAAAVAHTYDIGAAKIGLRLDTQGNVMLHLSKNDSSSGESSYGLLFGYNVKTGKLLIPEVICRRYTA